MTLTASRPVRLSAAVPSLVALTALLLLAGAHPALAVDGVIEINQTRALAGSVTSGDSPGFPVEIRSEGSYRLTGNLDVRGEDTPENVSAIVCVTVADNDKGVTIDLNGFSIIGPAVCSGNPIECDDTGSGRGIDAAGCEVRVFNGVVQGMGADGLYNVRVADRVLARTNGGRGIYATDAIVKDCHLQDNGGYGIEVLGDGLVTGNYLERNGGGGIYAGFGFTTVSGNTVTGSDGIGIDVFGLVSNNVIRNNDGLGLQLPATEFFGSGYVGNTIVQNNGGDANPQVSGGTELGTNLCGLNTTCP